MCGRTEQHPDAGWEVLGKHFGLSLAPGAWGEHRAEIKPTDSLAFIRATGGNVEVAHGRWGLVPDGMTVGQAKRYATFNAKAETVATARAFSSAYRSRRCLIPLSAFWEWPEVDGKKIRTRITRKDRRPLIAAGLWGSWHDDEGEHLSCTVITTEPNYDLAQIHDRQPVLLLLKDWDTWLHGDQRAAQPLLFRPYPAGVLVAEAG